ncbi:D-arabinono-1,4-lactone oxidase [Natrarchaeobius chitinivorans]|uniref:FAD-binding protein n=1 Tax=Natrarchaeobius chitinivorans TaxID=1679083 RepID=A0A3N6M1A1_NATCH|nr:D-arabinono-1,4-lactone oxidase [Natrarchaeobius chitinivorans]RQG97088.1 FAD-binding protein [Natrarchaeobius chitinivorans]
MSQEQLDEESPEEWTNWSGGISFEPDRVVKPERESELQSVVRHCAETGETVRVAGAGHSWTPVVETDGVVVSLENMTGVVSHDSEANEATIRGGTTLGEAGIELHERNLAMENLGDVTMQTVAGACGTGTHGTGAGFENLAGSLVGGRMVTGTGEIREFDAEDDPELLDAVRVSLGTLGIFTEIRLDLLRTYKLRRREYCARFEDFWDHLDDLIEENRNFDFYWYPRSDEVKLRLLNAPGGGTDDSELEYATLVEDETGWSHQVIPAHNEIGRKFEEMEYAVPREVAKECVLRARDRIRDRWRSDVGWRVLVRTVGADDSYLSTEYERETMTISCIQNAELEYWEYFEDMEPLFREYDGRPHWGKRHSLRAPELEELYPEWDRFQSFRRELDPEGVFTTDYVVELLGEVPNGGTAADAGKTEGEES